MSHYDSLADSMGYSKKRLDRHGKPRYTACYLDVRLAAWNLTLGVGHRVPAGRRGPDH